MSKNLTTDYSKATRIDVWHYSFTSFELRTWLADNTLVKQVVTYDDEDELFIFFNKNQEDINKFNEWIKDKKNV